MWRDLPGFHYPGLSDLQTIKAHFSHFLADRISSCPFTATTLPPIEWGKNAPFEKVIRTEKDLDQLQQISALHRNSLCIIEPWENVGENPDHEPVRSSLNVAYIAQQVGDLDSILLPVWEDITYAEPEKIARFASESMAYVVEGGAPAVYDASTFTHPKCSREKLLALIEELLLTRTDRGAPGLFICLGHQLAAEAHVRLIKRAVSAVQKNAPQGLKAMAEKIQTLGKQFGWDQPKFATSQNEASELRGHCLSAFQIPPIEEMGEEVIETYERTANAEGLIDLMQQYSGALKIDMFHRDIATDTAAIFCSYAYTKLHEASIPHRAELACSELSWLLNLPYAIKILVSTRANDHVVTANAATCIFYRDFDTGHLKRSYTTQFHPELWDDLKDFSHRQTPTYQELKTHSGNRMLVHLLQKGIHDA